MMDDASNPRSEGTGEDRGLNSFQKLMRCWTTLAPYNALQAIKISGIATRELWQTAADETLKILIGQKRIPPLPPLEPIEVADDGTSCIEIIVHQMNRPFREGECPIRLCLVPDGASYHLIMVYDHWLADSWSIRELMRCIYGQARDHSFTTELASVKAPERRSRWLESGRQCLLQYLRHRRAARLNFADPLDFGTGMVMQVLGADLIVRLKAAAKIRGVSVHDIFVTVIAQLMGGLSQKGRYGRRRFGHAPRDRVAIGSIVDIRKLLINPPSLQPVGRSSSGETLYDRHFGVSLGFTTTMTRRPESMATDELLRLVHSEHAAQKRRLSPVASLAALEVTRFFWNLYREKRHHAIFFSKNLPLQAGISNVNLTDQWMCRTDSGDFRILDYFRVSPVGPLLPLVWATTTFKDRLTVCLTYRQTAIAVQQATLLLRDFADMLERFVSC